MLEKKLTNSTKNSHFISQIEQRTNATNPNAKLKNQKIWQFEIQSDGTLILNKDKPVLIEKTLCDNYLFDLINNSSNKSRLNLENFFNQYERNYKKITDQILNHSKWQQNNLKNSLIQLFKLKILNGFRNPYRIKENVKNAELILNVEPTAIDNAEIFRNISCSKNDLRYFTDKYQVEEIEFINWRKILFQLLTTPYSESQYLLDAICENLLGKDSFIQIFLCRYTSDYTLLSDKAFVSEDMPILGSKACHWYFNINKHTFITFSKVDTSNQIDIIREPLNNGSYPNMQLTTIWNNEECLKIYNQKVIAHSFKYAYAATNTIKGVEIVRKHL